MSLVALCNNLDYFRKATTDTGISLIASDLIISCRTKKVKQYGGCAELCASLFQKKGSYKNVISFEKMSCFLRKCHVFQKNVILHVTERYAMLYLQKKENRRDSRQDKKIFQLLVSMIDTEKRKMGFHASEHGFHGLVYFLCPFLGGDAVARKKWQQKVKKEREEK